MSDSVIGVTNGKDALNRDTSFCSETLNDQYFVYPYADTPKELYISALAVLSAVAYTTFHFIKGYSSYTSRVG